MKVTKRKVRANNSIRQNNSAVKLTQNRLLILVAYDIHKPSTLYRVRKLLTSFARDLVEPFRATADKFAMQLFKEYTLRPEDFSTTEKGCLMGKAARTRFYPAYEKAAATWRPLIQKRALKYASDFTTEHASRQQTVVFSDNLPDEEEHLNS